MPRIAGDFAEMLALVASGRIDEVGEIELEQASTMTVIIAAKGYPGEPAKGGAIGGIDAAEADGAIVFYAGASESGGRLVASGGRVLAVTAAGESLRDARDAAYARGGEDRLRRRLLPPRYRLARAARDRREPPDYFWPTRPRPASAQSPNHVFRRKPADRALDMVRRRHCPGRSPALCCGAGRSAPVIASSPGRAVPGGPSTYYEMIQVQARLGARSAEPAGDAVGPGQRFPALRTGAGHRRGCRA